MHQKEKRYHGQVAVRLSSPLELVFVETLEVALAELHIGVKGVVRRDVFGGLQMTHLSATAETELLRRMWQSPGTSVTLSPSPHSMLKFVPLRLAEL